MGSDIPLYPFIMLGSILIFVAVVPAFLFAWLDMRREARKKRIEATHGQSGDRTKGA